MKTVYIYNKVKKSLRTVLFLSVGSLLFTGCSDFLDIKPMNTTVLENYWKEKADVTLPYKAVMRLWPAKLS